MSDEALAYAQRLATVAAAKFGPPEGWRVLPDLMGALSQIDNALTGLSRTDSDPLVGNREAYGAAAGPTPGTSKSSTPGPTK